VKIGYKIQLSIVAFAAKIMTTKNPKIIHYSTF